MSIGFRVQGLGFYPVAMDNIQLYTVRGWYAHTPAPEANYVCVCVCVCMCVCVCVCVCVRARARACVFRYTHTAAPEAEALNIKAFILSHAPARQESARHMASAAGLYVYVCVYVCILCMYVCIYNKMCVCVCVCVYNTMYICI